jgi:hypothetical protein
MYGGGKPTCYETIRTMIKRFAKAILPVQAVVLAAAEILRFFVWRIARVTRPAPAARWGESVRHWSATVVAFTIVICRGIALP